MEKDKRKRERERKRKRKSMMMTIVSVTVWQSSIRYSILPANLHNVDVDVVRCRSNKDGLLPVRAYSVHSFTLTYPNPVHIGNNFNSWTATFVVSCYYYNLSLFVYMCNAPLRLPMILVFPVRPTAVRSMHLFNSAGCRPNCPQTAQQPPCSLHILFIAYLPLTSFFLSYSRLLLHRFLIIPLSTVHCYSHSLRPHFTSFFHSPLLLIHSLIPHPGIVYTPPSSFSLSESSIEPSAYVRALCHQNTSIPPALKSSFHASHNNQQRLLTRQQPLSLDPLPPSI